MTAASFNIECNWLGESGVETDKVYASCRAGIQLSVNGKVLTRVEDLLANTNRDHVYANAYVLACWFASNWWRLRWEPEYKKNVEWRLSHSMASVGYGYSWPGIEFASDGERMGILCHASPSRVMGSVRYLKGASLVIPVGHFEQGVDEFLEQTLGRLRSMGHERTELEQLWTEVLRERSSEELGAWRRLEALCGFDPEEAPESLVMELIRDPASLGKNALEEVAAHSRHKTLETLGILKEYADHAYPAEGFHYRHPEPLPLHELNLSGLRPWERGREVAKVARNTWNLERTRPVSNMNLSDIFRTAKKNFKDTTSTSNPPMPITVRRKRGSGSDMYIGSGWQTTRRFTACRLLGGWLSQSNSPERLIPATEAKTSRQQFLRAFAQEFLCPFEALKEHLQTDNPSDEQIDDAAQHFGVSPLMVRTILVNKGILGQDELTDAVS